MQGESAELKRYFMIQTMKNVNEQKISKESFLYTKNSLKSQQQELTERNKEMISSLLKDNSSVLSDELGSDVNFQLGNFVPLGAFDESTNHLSSAILTKYRMSLGDQEITSLVAGTTTFARVKDRLLFLYVFSKYSNQNDLNWVRSSTKNWYASIIGANNSQEIDSNKEAVKRIEEKTFGGLITGLFLSITLILFHWFRKVFARKRQ
jgi:hypothetical protein